ALLFTLLLVSQTYGVDADQETQEKITPFTKDNLVAWCIVPFDAKKRNPEERAQMLNRLGITRLAYDWRANDIPFFEEEIDALAKHQIKLEAFWLSTSLTPEKDENAQLIMNLLKRKKAPAQIWVMLNPPNEMTESERIDACAQAIRTLAEQAQTFGGSIGLYNHGGWFGEPENQIKIIEQVHLPNVGIVYNFHHGHEHVSRFPEMFKKIQPYLLAVNLNGMRAEGPQILPIGEGQFEQDMIRCILESGYRGPIGILDHRDELDAEESLKQNLNGLQKVLKEIGDLEALKTY
ncbi:MAG: sugar phosphate isomerase/epimerase family protein, partial [Candidatus Hinthialibacter sp.]